MSERTYRRFIVAATVIALALLIALVCYTWTDAAPEVPPSITAAVRLENVVCRGPICCGYGAAIYRGWYYDTPASYCRWFRPLRDGQVVTATLTLVR